MWHIWHWCHMEVSKSSSAFGYRPNQQGMCLSDLFSRCWQTSLVLSHYIGPVVCMWLERLHSFLNEGCMKVGMRNEWMKCYWNIQITASAVFMIKCVTNGTITQYCGAAEKLVLWTWDTMNVILIVCSVQTMMIMETWSFPLIANDITMAMSVKVE